MLNALELAMWRKIELVRHIDLGPATAFAACEKWFFFNAADSKVKNKSFYVFISKKTWYLSQTQRRWHSFFFSLNEFAYIIC